MLRNGTLPQEPARSSPPPFVRHKLNRGENGHSILGRACQNHILHQALNFVELGLSINHLIETGKRVAKKAHLEYDPNRGIAFDLFLRWRLKAAFHDLAMQDRASNRPVPENKNEVLQDINEDREAGTKTNFKILKRALSRP